MQIYRWVCTLLSNVWKFVNTVAYEIEQTFELGSKELMETEPNPFEHLSIHVPISIEQLNLEKLPQGILVEIWGGDPTSHIDLGLQWVAQTQKRGVLCAWIDLAHGFNLKDAAAYNVDQDFLLLSQPISDEHMFEILTTLTTHNLVGLIVVDVPYHFFELSSLATSTPNGYLVSKKALASLRRLARQSLCTILFVHYTPTQILSADNPLRFYADFRLQPFIQESIKKLQIRVLKSRCSQL